MGKAKRRWKYCRRCCVGNIALFLVSGLKTVLALTVRNNDNDLPYYFMGKTELRDSWFKDGDKEKPAFKYKGFYANRNEERAHYVHTKIKKRLILS